MCIFVFDWHLWCTCWSKTNDTLIILINTCSLATSRKKLIIAPSTFNLSRGLINHNNSKHLCGHAGLLISECCFYSHHVCIFFFPHVELLCTTFFVAYSSQLLSCWGCRQKEAVLTHHTVGVTGGVAWERLWWNQLRHICKKLRQAWHRSLLLYNQGYLCVWHSTNHMFFQLHVPS